VRLINVCISKIITTGFLSLSFVTISYNMDVPYERNVTTLLTTIISNVVTITLLGIYKPIKHGAAKPAKNENQNENENENENNNDPSNEKGEGTHDPSNENSESARDLPQKNNGNISGSSTENDGNAPSSSAENDENINNSSMENGAIVPDSSTYMESFMFQLTHPIGIIHDASKALCSLISGVSLGMSYKYIRLLADTSYYINYETKEKLDAELERRAKKEVEKTENDKEIGKNTQVENDSDTEKLVPKVPPTSDTINTTKLPTLWLPSKWSEFVLKEEKGLKLYAPPEKDYISDPAFDGFYSVKSGMGCLFGAVQCTSTILISCLRLKNMDMLHTMDVLSMYTSYLLLCVVISVSFEPAYYCKPVVCIPVEELDRYTKLDKRNRLIQVLQKVFGGRVGRFLIDFLLFAPVGLMIALLIYINLYITLLWLLSVVSVSIAATASVITLIARPFSSSKIIPYTLVVLILGPLIALVTFSCLYATAEQRYPSSANWLPHF
jgi:hypothetical protein